ncbi:hypothetical protein ACTJLC_26425 [Paraburkholderia sp. 22099]|uniref:hypothetical protein n=1 Tax=Paraburkholderia sp. 22099 TaxID=3453875 RepID=UPI003F868642
MSILSDLFSLKGLITATATFAVTVKSLHITWNVSKQNVNVNGNNNIVIYNQALAPAQKSFKFLWNLLGITIFLTYPLFGPTFNLSLRILAYIGTPIAACAAIVNCKGFGLSRIWCVIRGSWTRVSREGGQRFRAKLDVRSAATRGFRYLL